MGNNFNNNPNKKDLSGSQIKYTTYRLNYGSDEVTENNGGMPPTVYNINLEDNKDATIDVSTYTEPIVIKPSNDKDAMKQTTVAIEGFKNYRMLPIRISAPANSSSNSKYAFIGAENTIFTKNSYTSQEAMNLLENTYILYNDVNIIYYYGTLIDYARQKINNDWSVFDVEIDKSSNSNNTIKFYGTNDHSGAKEMDISIRKTNYVLAEPFDFIQWSDYGAE